MKNHLKALWRATNLIVIYFAVVIFVFTLAYIICIFTECPKHQTFGEYYSWVLLAVIYSGAVSVFLSYMIYDIAKDIVKRYKEELKKLKNENHGK